MLTTQEPTKDLGVLKYGKSENFNYVLKNESSEPLHIEKVIVGCGSCTTAKVYKTNINPGDTTILQASFTPGSTGKQTKYIQVRYNSDSILKLEFTADVE